MDILRVGAVMLEQLKLIVMVKFILKKKPRLII